MALENLFIRTNRNIGGIQLDAVISESHSHTARVTNAPIEVGPDVSDHVIIEPSGLEINGVVSDTPLGLAALDVLSESIFEVFGTEINNGGTRSQKAFDAMIALKNAREPIIVSTKLKEYQNMIVTKVTTEQNKNSSHIVDMRISIQEIFITESEFVEIEKGQVSEDVANSATSTNDRGRVDQVEPEETKQSSWLVSISDWVAQ